MDTERILITWEPPPISERNGIITSYLLTVGPVAMPTTTSTTETADTRILVDIPSPDTAYSFSVAAMTVAIGPPSSSVVQRSYPLPPPPPESPPTVSDDADITVATIPINLPTMDTTQFRWVLIL